MTDALLLANSDAEALLAFLAFAVLMVTGITLTVWLSSRQNSQAIRELHAFAATLEGGAATGEPDFWTHLTKCHATGRLEGHDVRVSFVRRGGGKHAYTAIVYDLEVSHPAATFDVAEADALQALGRWLGLTKNDALNDGNLVLRAGGQSAGRLLQATDVRSALKKVLNQPGVAAVSLKGTTLRIEQRGAIRVQALHTTLRVLLELGRLCDRVPVAELISVRPREAAAPPELSIASRFAWTGGGETARCPYCRDELDAAAPDAAACERCGTVHHRECLDEAGGCTVFGCGAKATDAADRARS